MATSDRKPEPLQPNYVVERFMDLIGLLIATDPDSQIEIIKQAQTKLAAMQQRLDQQSKKTVAFDTAVEMVNSGKYRDLSIPIALRPVLTDEECVEIALHNPHPFKPIRDFFPRIC